MTEETFTKEQLDAAISEAVTNATKEAEARVSAMDAKVNELLTESKAAKAKAKEEAEARAKAADDLARNSGDIDALDKSWKAKFDEMDAAKNGEIDNLSKAIGKLTVGQAAASIASDLAVEGGQKALQALIAPMLGYEVKEGVATVVTKDASGKPSALTVDELKAKIKTDDTFAALVAETKASGGGAAGANGGAGKSKQVTRTVFDGMSQSERSEFSKSGGKVVND